MKSNHFSWTYIFIAHIKRDFLTNVRSLIDLISVIGFMLLIIILFPLGLGPDKEKMSVISSAIIWIGLILAILPSLDKILQKDFETGWLDQIATTAIPLEVVLLSKSLSYWLLILIPLIFATPLFAILLSIELKYLPWFILSMSIGGLAISLIGIIGSALILGAKRGNILLPILIIPLMIPILIFGVGVNEAVKIGEPPFSNLFLLTALTLIYLVISPFVSALLVRISIGR